MSYINVKFSGHCKMPLLFSLENDTIDFENYIDGTHYINYS